MLIRFRIENHRSMREEQELSFVAASLADFPNKVVRLEQNELDLLRVVGIYGANASGKSSVLSALKFMRSAVLNSQRNWEPNGGIPREPFLLDLGKISEPSFFEVDLLLNEIRYTYGFIVDSKQVFEEWLFAYPQGRKQKWFSRNTSETQEFNFSRFLTGENKSIQALTRNNSLFLSAAAQNNHKLLSPIFEWFSDSINFIDDGNREIQWRRTAEIFNDSNYKNSILSIFQNCDLGIASVDIEEEEIPEHINIMFERMFVDKPEILNTIQSKKTQTKVSFKHYVESNKTTVTLPFESESRGTQALFGLAGAVVKTLTMGGLLAIDELDSSLHPLMAIEIVKIFNDSSKNPNNAQLLFNTHDTNILEFGELRRDQIWFTEKDLDGGTRLYPLTDYKARREENIKRGYLQGRYGAVPFIRAFETLLKEGNNGKK